VLVHEGWWLMVEIRFGWWFLFAVESDDEAAQGRDANQTQHPRGAANVTNSSHHYNLSTLFF